MARVLRKIKVVPHFMRLHEWIAEEEGFYALEGLDAEIQAQTMYKVVNWDQEKYLERPQDMPFVEGEAVCNSACQWAVPLNAAAGMGRVVPDVYSVARFALFVRPESGITRLAQLRDVPVAVGRMAGSHFAALETFERVLPREHIKFEYIGGQAPKLTRLLEGTLDAALMLDPEISMAEEHGFLKIACGEFKILFWVSELIEQADLDAYFRALRRADAALLANPDKYMRLWEKNIPPNIRGQYDYSRFGLGEMMVFEPYTQEEYDKTLDLARRWGLTEHMKHPGGESLESLSRHVNLGTV